VLLNPSRAVVSLLGKYDPALFIKWNNRGEWFEVWRRMPWGDRIITPVWESIYIDGGEQEGFYPLDERIMGWLFSADSQRRGLRAHDTAKRLLKIGLEKMRAEDLRAKELSAKRWHDKAKDSYYIINPGLINFDEYAPRQWVRPDVGGRGKRRVMQRSGSNAAEYFNSKAE